MGKASPDLIGDQEHVSEYCNVKEVWHILLLASFNKGIMESLSLLLYSSGHLLINLIFSFLATYKHLPSLSYPTGKRHNQADSILCFKDEYNVRYISPVTFFSSDPEV